MASPNTFPSPLAKVYIGMSPCGLPKMNNSDCSVLTLKDIQNHSQTAIFVVAFFLGGGGEKNKNVAQDSQKGRNRIFLSSASIALRLV